MKRRLCISIQPYIFESCLTGVDNISGKIEEALLMSQAYEEGSIKKKNEMLLKLNEQNKDLKKELQKVVKENIELKQKIEKIKENEKMRIEKNKEQTETEIPSEQFECDVCGELNAIESKYFEFKIGKVCYNCYMTGNNSNKWFKPKEKKKEDKIIGVHEHNYELEDAEAL